MSPSGTISEAMVDAALDAAGHRSTEYSRKWMRAALAAALSVPTPGTGGAEPVGEAGTMPGTDGFTMACFKAVDVPVGTKLYTAPLGDAELLEAAERQVERLLSTPQAGDLGAVKATHEYKLRAMAENYHGGHIWDALDAETVRNASEEIAALRSALSSSPVGEMVHQIEHDGFEGTVIGSYVTREGKRGVVLQQVGTKVVHVYGEKWLGRAIGGGR